MKKLLKIIAVMGILVISLSAVLYFVSGVNLHNISNANTIGDIGETTYGIATENYNVMYELDADGNIVMSAEDFEELKQFSKDSSEVKKVIRGLAEHEGMELSAMSLNSRSTQIASDLQAVGASDFSDDIVVISDSSDVAAVKSASNIKSALRIHEVESSGINGFKITLKYSMHWIYQPHFTGKDTVAMTWNDNLDSDGSDCKFNYYQSSSSYSMYQDIKARGDDAYDYPSKAGVGYKKEYDIKSTFAVDETLHFATKHSVSMYITIFRNKLTDIDDGTVTCTASYFHQLMLPNIGEIIFKIPDIILNPEGEALRDTAIINYDVIDHKVETIDYGKELGWY